MKIERVTRRIAAWAALIQERVDGFTDVQGWTPALIALVPLGPVDVPVPDVIRPWRTVEVDRGEEEVHAVTADPGKTLCIIGVELQTCGVTPSLIKDVHVRDVRACSGMGIAPLTRSLPRVTGIHSCREND
jgi:hypothetical protein